MDEIKVGTTVRHKRRGEVGVVASIPVGEETGLCYIHWDFNDDDEPDPVPFDMIERVKPWMEVTVAPLLDKIDAALREYIDADDMDLPIEIFELTKMIREKLREE